jgi:prepilin-type N-terminal cleavage/methylation domain-containing protein
MRKRFYNFTLVEMLTVIAIIGILAGIVIPVVAISRRRGMVSRAESEVTTITAALKQLDADYKKVLTKDNKIGSVEIDSSKISSNIATIDGDAYDAMIAELSAPKNSVFTTSNPVSVNKRKKVYLDPRKDFDPTKAYTDQKDLLYRDPWGNPYKIYVRITHDDELALPGTSKTIVANFAVYSFGPNKTDDNGCNSAKPICGASDCKHDDISSWAL